MKHLLVALLLVCHIGYAQITLEHTYTGPIWTQPPLELVHFTGNGDKYAEVGNSLITIYNLNHSVLRTIVIPSQPAGSYAPRVHWISDELFNTNPTDVEYILTYETSSPSIEHVRIYDESGNILLARDSFSLKAVLNPYGVHEPDIVHTTNGSKLLLINQYTLATEVYALPGIMPCTMCDHGVMSGIATQPGGSNDSQQQLPNPYPNPANSVTTIPYTLPVGVSTGTIIIYDIVGREVKRYSVSNAFNSLLLSADDLANGTYSYTLETETQILPGKQFVIAK